MSLAEQAKASAQQPTGSLAGRLQDMPWVNKTIVVALLFLVWEVGVRLGDVNPLVLPAPSQVAVTFGQYLANGKLLAYTYETMVMLLGGMAVGGVVALVLTTLASLSRFGKDLLTTLTAILNPLPAIAVLPLALIWLGIGPKSLLFVNANSVVWGMAYRGAGWRKWLALAGALAAVGLVAACGGRPTALASNAVSAGREVFRRQGCLRCHALGGEGGRPAPDLNRVGSRMQPDQIRKMITDPRSIRPDSRMPRYTGLSEAELEALVAYLASLR